MIDKDDQNKNGEDANDASFHNTNNDYGLPEAEYSPVEREQPLGMNEDPAFNATSFEEEPAPPPAQKSTNWILYSLLILIVGIASVFVYFFVFEEPEPTEQVVQAPIEDFTPVIEEPAPIEEPVEEEWEPAEPEVQEGTVSNVDSRTGRYYLIVGSFIDGDLAKDYGQKLTKEGISSKIIEPDGTRKFYRLSVKDAETVSDLNADLDLMKAKFGENVWIVKY